MSLPEFDSEGALCESFLAKWRVFPGREGTLSESDERARSLARIAYRDVESLTRRILYWRARATLAEEDNELLRDELRRYVGESDNDA